MNSKAIKNKNRNEKNKIRNFRIKTNRIKG